ncbi:hypothetical protein LOTGIDRAFT_155091 [Lottia gigantea]|uniref:Capsid protein n=1 Tax=Lottia gigantea TaxID=225164 RepID=V3Z4J3_LOTGI|nr:hypothetical protein LOTGIDRAFT_155091 [Lottia gigantea]ESO85603.1 hypothetical protein LOTGIDRAFT_155091 [Lottia gigantea]
MAFYQKRRNFNRSRFYAKKRSFYRRRRLFYRRKRAPYQDPDFALFVFDEVKIRHVTLVYWLTYQQPTITSTYDPDAQGRTMTVDNQNARPNTREKLLHYGRKYTLKMYPKFQPKLSSAKSVAIGGKAISPWIDSAYFTYGASPASSMNGIIYTIQGSPNTFVEGFYSVGLSWKGRRDGQVYSAQASTSLSDQFEVLDGYDTVN